MDQYNDISEIYELVIPEAKGLITYYTSFINNGDYVLDIGCGTGRLAFELEKKGAKVIGIDVSEGMIEKALIKKSEIQSQVQFITGDFNLLTESNQFDYVFMSGGVFEYFLTPRDQKEALLKINNLLKNKGKFIFDMITPPHILPFRNRNEKYDSSYNYSYDGDIKSKDYFQYNNVKQIIKTKNEFILTSKEDSRTLSFELFTRYSTPIELKYLLELNGFIIQKFHGDFECTSFNSQSLYMIIESKKK